MASNLSIPQGLPPELTFITEAQLCAIANISHDTAARWRCTRTRGPKFTKAESRLVRYKLSDVLAWLQAGEQTTAEQK